MKSHRCKSCGVPLEDAGVCNECQQEMVKYNIKPPKKSRSKFVWFFIGLIVFCAVMIVYLPR